MNNSYITGNTRVPRFERPVRIPSGIKLDFAKPRIVFAGSRTDLKLKFHIPVEIKSDDVIKIQLFGGRNNKGSFSNIQCDDERKDGFISVKYNNYFLKISQKKILMAQSPSFHLTVELKKAGLLSVDL